MVCGKQIHVLLKKESWEELEALKKKLGLENLDNHPKTYEEYLAEEERHPTMAYCA